MSDHTIRTRWTMQVVFLVLAGLLIFLHLLPIETSPRQWAMPDVLLAFTFAWILRRPDYLPVLLVAAIFLIEDLLFQRPPGLRSALIILASEWLRAHAQGFRTTTFLHEWLHCAILLTGVHLLNHVLLGVFFVDQPNASLTAFQSIVTILTYPAIAATSHYVFGVRKLVPGDSRRIGRLS